MTKVICLPGTWQSGMNLFNRIHENLSDKAAVFTLKVPSSYGDGMSYNESVQYAIKNTIRLVEMFEGDIYLCGFSQGAHAAGSVAQAFKDDPKVKAAYLISDPMRSNKDKLVGPPVKGHGVMGSREIGPKAYHFSASDDFVSANDNAFISNAARYTYDMNMKRPQTWLSAIKVASQQHVSGGSVIRGINEVRQALASQSHIRYDKYEVSPGLTVPDWISRDILSKIESS